MGLAYSTMRDIRFKDEVIEQIKEMEAGTKQQQFNADFLMMTETLNGLFKDLLASFGDKPAKIEKIGTGNVVSIAINAN